jgi:UDP-N-acetylglucosamine transferase subunit ALG13
MIFFTLGTEHYPFNRLVEVAEKVATLRADEEVFVQIGNHPDPPRGCRWDRFLPFEEFAYYIRHARVVVSHAGAGTILTCAVHGRVPIVLKREWARGEHVDNHQSQLARRMQEAGRIVLAETPEKTLEAILNCESSASGLQSADEVPELARSLARYLTGLEQSSAERPPERARRPR